MAVRNYPLRAEAAGGVRRHREEASVSFVRACRADGGGSSAPSPRAIRSCLEFPSTTSFESDAVAKNGQVPMPKESEAARGTRDLDDQLHEVARALSEQLRGASWALGVRDAPLSYVLARIWPVGFLDRQDRRVIVAANCARAAAVHRCMMHRQSVCSDDRRDRGDRVFVIGD